MNRSTQTPRGAVLRPLYGQVRDLLATRISSGVWGPGATIPNEASLAADFNVSIGTIRRAVEALEDLGLVVRRQGRGTYVGGLGLSAAADRLCRLRNPSGSSMKLTYQNLGRDRRVASANEIAHLQLDGPTEVLEVRTLAFNRSTRFGIETSVIPGDLAAGLAAEPEGAHNLYAMLGKSGVLVTTAEDTVSSGLADAEQANHLRISANQPLLLVRRIAFGIDQRPVEYRHGAYVSSHTTYCTKII